MNLENDRAYDEARIRELAEAWRQAVLAKDAAALVAHYAPDVVVFDVVPPASMTGVQRYCENWQRWFDSIHGPLAFDVMDMHIAVSGELAYAHSLNRVAAGGRDDIVRATVCFKKIDGDWRVVHEHASVPLMMDMDPDESA
ncbi:nuclear transport factor 2 family protein [Caballeronia sp. LZ062]|uniref:YybH family protein n=1 Tax=unclassified Caballeronia TaxID=2646786 RepID=UPI002866215B|nr:MULTISPECIES: nuclear transport factor 2 family protein [unclassified Caballeronia]MDR5857624.1 nuclear transport factor 2 family protein [Caballeronia sp. LZ050]MDR5869174.1 nuclear transport factor 2 family protein [Caballeronia sp. LZ062]